jgi:hypothetical protein
MSKSGISDPTLQGFNMMPFIQNQQQAMSNMYADLGLTDPGGQAAAGIGQAGATNQLVANNQTAANQFSLDANAANANSSSLGNLASTFGTLSGLRGGTGIG